MIININQHKISASDRYNIYIDRELAFKARGKNYRIFFHEINLFDLQNNLRRTIRSNFHWFKPKYSIIDSNNSTTIFLSQRFWKVYYTYQNNNDKHEIIGHKGRKVSIFKNNNQIAFFDRKAVSWFYGDNYRIVADDDCDAELLICFVLIMDYINDNNSDGSTATYHFGNIGPQMKKFDESWRAKTIQK